MIKKRFFALCILLFLILASSILFVFKKIDNNAQKQPPKLNTLKTVKDIPLSCDANRFDYQSINPGKDRLYLSHMNSDMVTVFDLKSEKIIVDIKDIRRPTGILSVPELGKVYVSGSKANEVVVIDEQSLKIVKRIEVGGFPDGIAYDPGTKRIFVSDEHGKQVTVIDAKTDVFIKNIEMGGEVGNTHYDPVSGLIYTAVQTNDELVSIDPSSLRIIKRFKLDGCKGPHGFYIDSATHYAMVTGEDQAQFFVFDLTSFKIIYRDKTGADPDVLAFDTTYHRLYVSGEEGIISIFSIEKNNIRKLSEGFIANHAHSIAVDQTSHLVYLPLENIGGKPVLRIMESLK